MSRRSLNQLICMCMHEKTGPWPLASRSCCTTVEIRDRQRAKLFELAARRGEKGFSKLVQEAIDLYLKGACPVPGWCPDREYTARMWRACVLTAFLGASASSALAGFGPPVRVATTTSNPPSWDVRAVSPDGLVAGWVADELHVSTDGGRTWQARGKVARGYLTAPGAGVLDLVASEVAGAVFHQRSTDAGATWSLRSMVPSAFHDAPFSTVRGEVSIVSVDVVSVIKIMK